MVEMLLNIDPLYLALGATSVVAVVGGLMTIKKHKKNINNLSLGARTEFEPESYTLSTAEFGSIGDDSSLQPLPIKKPKLDLQNEELDFYKSSLVENEDSFLNYDSDSTLEEKDDLPNLSHLSSKEKLELALNFELENKIIVANYIVANIAETETHEKEKVRFKVIQKKYSKQEHSLADLVNKYPSLIKDDDIETNSFQESMKKTQPIPIYERIDSEHIQIEPTPDIDNNKLTKLPSLSLVDSELQNKHTNAPTLLESQIIQVAQKAQEQETNNEEDNTKFMKAFGGLIEEIHEETKPPKQFKINSHEVWVNWMSMANGKMGLKSQFFKLNCAWGNKKAVEDLQSQINQIMGKDSNQNQNPWALLSVHQVNES